MICYGINWGRLRPPNLTQFDCLKEELSNMDDPLLPSIIILILLIFVNAFFASAEIAVISLNEGKLARQAEEGDKTAARLLRLVHTPDRFLSTIQIVITLAGFLNAAFTADSFAGRLVTWLTEEQGVTALPADVLHSMMVIVVTIILSYFNLVLGELVPKRLAMQRTEQVARAVAGPVGVLSVLFSPVVWFLSLSTNAVLRLLRVDPKAESSAVSEEEIRMMVDIGEEKGAIEAGEKEMIENIFEFNNMTAEDVMVHRTDMVMLWLEDSPEEIIKTIEDSGLSRFPVCDSDADDIVGILNTRIYLLNARRPEPKPLRDLLRPAYFVPESVRTDVLFRDMQSRKEHLAIVVDEYGGTSGLVTMEDLLEEIVGNIYDEFDPQDEQEIVPLGENLWRVAGWADLEDVGKALGVSFPEDEEADTLGGLVFAQLSVIPDNGSHPEVDVCGLHIVVEELNDRRVEWARVSKLPPAPPEEKD